MNAIRAVVADTTPLNYLILINHAEILGSLFGAVLEPEAVLAELQHPKALEAVKRWLGKPPAWLHVSPVRRMDETVQLGKGESEAISLALEHKLKVILMDERRGRAAAVTRGLLAVGTLNLIDLADEMGLLDGIAALDSLRQTTFRAESDLLDRLRAGMIETLMAFESAPAITVPFTTHHDDK